MKSYINRIKNQVHSILSERSIYFQKLSQEKLQEITSKKFKNYLDLGQGSGDITNFFSKFAEKTEAIDSDIRQFRKARKKFPKLNFIHADIYDYKFNKKYDLVTAFSFFEHVNDLDKAIDIVSRINIDYLIIQMPNKYFLIDLNTYLPLFFLLPLKLKLKLQKFGYTKDALMASRLSKRDLYKKLSKKYKISVVKVIYPEEILPNEFRLLYRVLLKTKIFSIVPFGYILICKRNKW
jgi:trans-aconitate methyltransferase